jgi:putative membrane protein
MHGWGDGFWIGPFNMILWLVILVLVVAAVAWWINNRSATGETRALQQSRSPALEALEQRYARGEIGREEYLQKKQDIAG